MPPHRDWWLAMRAVAILMKSRIRLFADRPAATAVANARAFPLKVYFLHAVGD